MKEGTTKFIFLNTRLNLISIVFVLSIIAGILSPIKTGQANEVTPVIISSGNILGVYFPISGAICHSLNSLRQKTQQICAVVPGSGSLESIELLREKKVDFAIVQSDWQYWAFKGAGFFKDPTPFEDLRTVVSFYTEPLIMAVRNGEGVKSLDDLKGLNISIGQPNSAARAMMEELMRIMGWSFTSFNEIHEMSVEEQSSALCNNRIDAAVYATGSPSSTLINLTNKCSVSFLPIKGPEIKALLENKVFYQEAIIPSDVYKGINSAVPSFGVGPVLVTRKDVSDVKVKKIVEAMFSNLDSFRKLHPALNWLKEEKMKVQGMSSPLHSAASLFFSLSKR